MDKMEKDLDGDVGEQGDGGEESEGEEDGVAACQGGGGGEDNDGCKSFEPLQRQAMDSEIPYLCTLGAIHRDVALVF